MEHTGGQHIGHREDPTRPRPAREDHGRTVTANLLAAAWYREAQRAVDRDRTIVALRLAVAADSAFGLAQADLSAITGAPARGPRRGQMNWERHHIEVVLLAATGNLIRASGLLREHLACVGCDPLAYRIARFRRAAPADDLDDIADQLPRCHALTLALAHPLILRRSDR